MTTTCRVYGLRLQLDHDVSGLGTMRPVHDVDVQIAMRCPDIRKESSASRSFYVSDFVEADGTPSLRVAHRPVSRDFRFEYADGTVVVVDDLGSRVRASGPPEASLEDTATYLIGPILGFILRLRGVTCLHASAIAVGDRAVAFLGRAGAGKSSLAAAFACRGYAVLADDIVALHATGGVFAVHPGYPRVKLWPESVRALFDSSDALPRITPAWEKRYLPLGEGPHRFQDEPLPLAAIYLVGERAATSRIEAMNAQSALMSLVANTYSNRMLDRGHRESEFDFLGNLVEALPVRKLTPSSRIEWLPRLCDDILDDLARCAPE